jgi:Flp pilus assembly pilin Flp
MEIQMKPTMSIRKMLASAIRDESGGETLDFALLVGFMVLAILACMSAMGIKVMEKWANIWDYL